VIKAQFIRQLEGIEMVRPGERQLMHWTRLTFNFHITENSCCHLRSEKYQLMGLWLAFILSTNLSVTGSSLLVRVCGFVKARPRGFILKLNLKSGTQTSILNRRQDLQSRSFIQQSCQLLVFFQRAILAFFER